MDAFAAVADPMRRSLLRSLRGQPARVVDLAEGLPISRPAVSKHLRHLVEAGLVSAVVHGRERHYTLVQEGLSRLADLLESLSGVSPGVRLDAGALAALDTEVRRTSRERGAATPATPAGTSHPHKETA